MAIVDVEIPSGFQHVEHTDLDNAIERTDIRGDNAVFYINGVSSSIHQIHYTYVETEYLYT